MADLDLEDVDIFRILTGMPRDASPTCTCATYENLVVQTMAKVLRLSTPEVCHLFNVERPLPSTEEWEADAEDDTSSSCEEFVPSTTTVARGNSHLPEHEEVNEPLCVHLQREGVDNFLMNPRSIPTVLCRAAEETADASNPTCHHGGPHVHCVFCLTKAVAQTANFDRSGVPPRLVELQDCWYEHYMHHQHRSARLLELLDGTGAYVGDSDEDYDLDNSDDVADCEADAAEAARHGCFLVSAGTVASPVIVAYCAHCAQFAPMGHFQPPPVSATATSDADVSRNNRAMSVSEEDVHTIMARLLVAAHFYMTGPTRAAQVSEKSKSKTTTADDLEAVYLYKPSFFDYDTEEALLNAFEANVECTYTSVVLPAARVVGYYPAPRLLLLDEKIVPDSPTVKEGVEGFLMLFPSAAVARNRIRLVQEHLPEVHVARRLVYVGDTNEWTFAHVLYEYDCSTSPAAGSLPAYEDPTDYTEAIRCVNDYTVPSPIPYSTAEGGGLVPEMADFPFSMHSRTVNFLIQMTAIAQAMHLVLERGA